VAAARFFSRRYSTAFAPFGASISRANTQVTVTAPGLPAFDSIDAACSFDEHTCALIQPGIAQVISGKFLFNPSFRSIATTPPKFRKQTAVSKSLQVPH